MALSPAFKTDESFLEKVAIGVTATRRTIEDLLRQGHEVLELERGATSLKIWKELKTKRVRMADLLCLRCGHRVESRGKTKLEITMSHSRANPERAWNAGLDDRDLVALVACEKTGAGATEWRASDLVQYVPVGSMRQAFQAGQVATNARKGVQEGSEVRVTWPAVVAERPGVVESVNEESLVVRYDGADRATRKQLRRKRATLSPAVAPEERFTSSRILAAAVPVLTSFACPGGAHVGTYLELARSTSPLDRYAAVKALGRFSEGRASEMLAGRLRDGREEIYVRLEAGAALIRRGETAALRIFEETLRDEYPQRRLEAVIVLAEAPVPAAVSLLLAVLADHDQATEVRAGAAWALGAVAGTEALEALIGSFRALETRIRVEAARALAKLARRHLREVVERLPGGGPEERPGIAWAVSKAGGFMPAELAGLLVDEDARHWVAYIVGTQDQAGMMAGIEDLARRDPEVYFAVTVLWKILSSWVYGLEEY